MNYKIYDKLPSAVAHIADIHKYCYIRHDEFREVTQNFVDDFRERTKHLPRHERLTLIVGDVFEQKTTISNEAINEVSEFFHKILEISPIILVCGNHDLAEQNLTKTDCLTPIVTAINSSELFYLTRSQIYDFGAFEIANFSIFEKHRRPDGLDIPSDKLRIGLFHAPVQNSRTLHKTFGENESMKLDHFLGCDVVIMGDIHKYQVLEHKGIQLVYCGSLIQQNAGESVDGHGYCLWDFNDLSHQFIEVENSYGIFKIKISSLQDMIDGNFYAVNFKN